jgi:hypothetical protein
VEIVESIVEIEVTREDNIEGRTKRTITMPRMYINIKKAKYKDGNLGAYHFKSSRHCRACMQ